MRWKLDEVDLWCTEWSATRRMIHGIVLAAKLEPRERIGKLSCTLGRIKEDREGAASAGVVNQNWPEVYTGMGLLVHRGWASMPAPYWRLVMDAHYVWREVPVREKAAVIGVTPSSYWKQLDLLKAYLAGYVMQNRDVTDGAYFGVKSPTFVRLFA